MSAGAGADRQAAFCAVMCDEWARSGVTDAVVAPGSRSTPLVAALAAEDQIRVHVVLDERSAGFVALGLGSAEGRPAVVVTTSGTASVELHPAVVEASQGCVPLIAATADRPPELHHVGAPQTVDQRGLFAHAVRWEVDGGVAMDGAPTAWRSLAARTVAEASGGSAGPGPVHLNLPFREPLLGSGDASAVAGRDGRRAWHVAGETPLGPPARVTDLLRGFAGGNGLVVAGRGAVASPGPVGQAQVAEILDAADRLGWPVLADPLSGCRIDHPAVVSFADSLLRQPEMASSTPEVVVRIGATWASKVLAQWLAGLDASIPQVVIDPWGRWFDPDRTASMVVHALPSSVLSSAAHRAGAGEPGPPSQWAQRWRIADIAGGGAIAGLLDPGGRLEMSEPAVARAVLRGVPETGQLVVSSSMPVRDVEWFGGPRAGVCVISNRGANGIDGVLSTAIGAALARGAPTVALLGDLAFLYDAGALVGSASRELSLSVVVVDNDGGGIFSFLPHASAFDGSVFERYWGTPHGLDLVAVAAGYAVDACSIDGRQQLDHWLAAAGGTGLRVGVIRSDRSANVAHHDDVNAAVSAAVSSALARAE
jgi:2-succinyl-5-enolpyruvyl-6-hydroxy-3-cyclohexene-1-carboxylate synthase